MTACGGVELSFQATVQYDNFQFFKGLALRAPSPNFCPIQALLVRDRNEAMERISHLY